MAKQLQTEVFSTEQALDIVQEAVAKAGERKKFLVAIWSIDDDEIMHKQIVSWRYPKHSIPIAVAELQQYARTEQMAQPDLMDIPPLPAANKETVFAGMELDPSQEDADE